MCSPLARARETAGHGRRADRPQPEEDARFTETDTGDWTDRSFAEIRAEDPEGFRRFESSDPTFRYPGGESFAEQSDRVQAGLADLRARAAGAARARRLPPRRHPPRARRRDRRPHDGGREIGNATLVTV